MAFEDARFVLITARANLEEIIQEQKKAIIDNEISQSLLNKTRYYLSDIMTVLDYIGYEIFEQYCISDIPPEERDKKRGSVYFPIGKNSKEFRKKLEAMYKGLAEKKPEVVSIFERNQPYHIPEWLDLLGILNNHNKHRFFTLQEVEVKKEIIKIEARDTGQNITYNIKQLEGTNMKVTRAVGHDINPDTNLPNPSEGVTAEKEKWMDFIFTKNNKSVVGTLSKFLEHTDTLLKELTMCVVED